MPRSLFLKIFLWFGIVVLTVIAGGFIVGMINHDRLSPPMHKPFDEVISDYAREAAREYERGGQAALSTYLDRVEGESHIHALLFNNQLQELSGRPVPTGASDLVRKVFETRRPEVVDGSPPLMAQLTKVESGDEYVLVSEPPRRRPPSLFYPLLHLLLIILTGGLFCYWLARYLTSPVTKLRAATRDFAAGNLSVRVGPTLGKRRDELASLAADFDEMAEKIQSLVDSQRRLLGDISHELRSPLARLNVALELARQRSGAEASSALERIQLEAETLNEMIGQLLALTRLESGAEEIRKSEFDLAALVSSVTEDADFEARSRMRSVKLESPPSCTIVGNEQLLRRAIENVVRNAVQYTGAETEVVVKLDCADSGVAVLTVRDHGPGVPENALTEIFRPFYRVDDARDRGAGGVGLGLAIAERAIRLHGGKVQAANPVDGGLVVTISLPVSAKGKD